MTMRRALPLLLLAVLAGCSGSQSAMGGAGRQGAVFVDLFHGFLAVAGIVYLIVLLFLAHAALRRGGSRRDGLPDEGRSREAPLRTALVVWVGLSALILAGLSVASWFADRGQAEPSGAPAIEVEITANQWWWDVRYQSADPSRIIHTANELHLPVGAIVRITLKSNDVIHSFWVPNLAGKQDLIPGRTNDIEIRPLVAGHYRGQCAEFCGIQHANMALDVFVESPAAFAAWQQAQGQTPPPPSNPLTRAGYDVFNNRQCSSCHAIAGTPASGAAAPDLSHVASRPSIGAGALPMSRSNLSAWIADPQAAKPGNNMPIVPLSQAELNAVTAYLETLR
jgi:cytochrome c oxidase subunit 2